MKPSSLSGNFVERFGFPLVVAAAVICVCFALRKPPDWRIVVRNTGNTDCHISLFIDTSCTTATDFPNPDKAIYVPAHSQKTYRTGHNGHADYEEYLVKGICLYRTTESGALGATLKPFPGNWNVDSSMNFWITLQTGQTYTLVVNDDDIVRCENGTESASAMIETVSVP